MNQCTLTLHIKLWRENVFTILIRKLGKNRNFAANLVNKYSFYSVDHLHSNNLIFRSENSIFFNCKTSELCTFNWYSRLTIILTYTFKINIIISLSIFNLFVLVLFFFSLLIYIFQALIIILLFGFANRVMFLFLYLNTYCYKTVGNNP